MCDFGDCGAQMIMQFKESRPGADATSSRARARAGPSGTKHLSTFRLHSSSFLVFAGCNCCCGLQRINCDQSSMILLHDTLSVRAREQARRTAPTASTHGPTISAPTPALPRHPHPQLHQKCATHSTLTMTRTSGALDRSSRDSNIAQPCAGQEAQNSCLHGPTAEHQWRVL